MNIADRVAVVTGGASGLGAATVERLRADGAKVAAVDRSIRNAAQPEANLLLLPCDVTAEADGLSVFEQVEAAFGTARILVNCAGIVESRKILSRKGLMSLEHFRQVIDVHMVGTFNMTRLYADRARHLDPLDDSGERGVVINTSSVAAFEGQIGAVSYSSAKAGIAGMTLPLAREFAEHGIRVCAIAPGLMETPMMGELKPEAAQHMLSTVPFPNRFGSPAEYADLAAFLIQNQMMNGEVIRLDAAFRMPPA